MKDEKKEILEDIIEGVIDFILLIGIGSTILLGFIKLCIWIWSV